MSENLTVAKLDGVSKIYGSKGAAITALANFNLTVSRLEFTALAGPSGSGKTTLLNLMGALDKPSSGQVTIDGHLLADLNRSQLSRLRRDKIGFVFQSFNLFPVLTARENAEFTLCLQKRPKAERQARALEALQAVGLAELAQRYPHQLSGGQQQRVAIARALAAQPALILADEPTASLDSRTAEALINLMEKLNAEHGVTFVFSTHDPRIISRARRVVQLVDGELVSDIKEVRA